MNRQFILSLALLATTLNIKGQVVKWLIPPVYDNIQMVDGEGLIITDSLDNKIIWSHSGKRLSMTKDHISSFEEGFAVTTRRESRDSSEVITGFYDKNGNFTALSDCKATYSMPCFTNHHLLVQKGSFYWYVNTKGEMDDRYYINAYPFVNGYASCRTYTNLQKKKDPYNLLLSKDDEQISFSYNGKVFDNDDIAFVSSVNDENIGIVIAKNKLYYFNGKNRDLLPVFARRSETNIKNQAKLEDEVYLCFSVVSDSVIALRAKAGKNDKILIFFDRLMIPLSIRFADREYVYKKNAKTKTTYESPLQLVMDGGKCGIVWDKKYILPPQLDDIITCFGDKAFVRLSGKCGMFQVFKDEDFKITVNKGNPIDFRHQKYETTIRLDLPKMISAFSTRIDVDPKSGCEVDLTSGEKKDTEFGNYIQYNCVLNIPRSLPDEMYGDERNEIAYPTQIVYDGLRSPVIPFKVKAWHYKYFNVDVNEAETSINHGTLSFTFNINAERTPGEAVYPTTVNIQTDSLKCELEKISETRYKCQVFALNEGMNNIVVQILEEGCPPASFPFEVVYTKPADRTRNKPAVKEDVAIQKKTKKTQVTPTPYLDI